MDIEVNNTNIIIEINEESYLLVNNYCTKIKNRKELNKDRIYKFTNQDE